MNFYTIVKAHPNCYILCRAEFGANGHFYAIEDGNSTRLIQAESDIVGVASTIFGEVEHNGGAERARRLIDQVEGQPFANIFDAYFEK